MNDIRTKILIIFLIILSTNIFAQLSDAELDVEDDAFAAFDEGDYEYAAEKFSQLISLHPKNGDYNYYYAVCLLKQNKSIPKALQFLEYSKGKTSFPEVYYYLGMAYHLSYDFDKAISNYKKFKQKYGEKKAEKDYDINRQIKLAENGKELIQYISDLTVLENKKIKLNNFYYSYKLDDIGGKIIVKPEEFKTKKDKKSNDSQLMFLSDSGYVYFSSYGKKGTYGLDIYRAKKNEDGSWTTPERLPETINTKYDENYPFLWVDGKTLYFSSKGHNSMGGYDIFKTVFDSTTNAWSKPENLDFPTNTPYDDFLYVADSKDVYAYFSSNRETYGDKISVYKILIDHFPERKPIAGIEEIKAKAKLQVSDKETIEKTKIKNNKENKEIIADNSQSSKKDFSYSFSYIKPSEISSNKQLIDAVSSDSVKIAKDIERLDKEYKKSMILAYQKQNEYFDKKAAAKKLLEENSNKQAQQLNKEADKILIDAIMAYNVAQLKKDEKKRKKKLLANTSQISQKVRTGDDIITNLSMINKNRTELEKNKNLFKNIDDEIRNKNAKLAQITKEYNIKKSQAKNVKKELDAIKQKIDKADEAQLSDTEKRELYKRHNELVSQYAAIKADEILLEEKINNKNSEIASLKNVKMYIAKSNDDNLSAYNNLNEIELKNNIDEQSFELEARLLKESKEKANKTKQLSIEEYKLPEENIYLAEKSQNNEKNEQNSQNNNINEEFSNNNTEQASNQEIASNEKTDSDINQTNTQIENKASNNKTGNTNNTGISNSGQTAGNIAATNSIIANNTNKTSNNNTPAPKKLTEKEKEATAQEVKILKQEAETAQNIADSLNTIIASKKQQLNTETNSETKAQLEKDIADLTVLAEMKQKIAQQTLQQANALESTYLQNEQNNIAQNTNTIKTENTKKLPQNNNISNEYNDLQNYQQTFAQNKSVIDSLNTIAEQKTQEAQKTKDKNQKEMLLAEADDLKTLAQKKQDENAKLSTKIEQKQNELYSKTENIDNEKDLAQIDNLPASSKLSNYEKQVLIKNYYQNKNTELKSKLKGLNETKQRNISEGKDFSAIDKEIEKTRYLIAQNEEKQAVAQIKAEKIKKSSNQEITTPNEEKLFADATNYSLKNTNVFQGKQKKQFEKLNNNYQENQNLYNSWRDKKSELNKLKKQLEKATDKKTKQQLEKQIKETKKLANELLSEYIDNQTENNFDTYYLYSSAIDTLKKTKAQSDKVNKILSQADLYFSESQELNKDKNSNHEEKLQAVNLGLIALNKQKQAIDLLQNAPQISTQTNTQQNYTLSLNGEDENNIKTYSTVKYKLDKKKNKYDKALSEIKEEKKKAKKIYGPKRSEKLKTLEEKELALIAKAISTEQSYKNIDSLKYSVYKDKLPGLISKSQNKSLANEYLKAAEYYHSKAEELRAKAKQETDLRKKYNLIRKANSLDNTALQNQEIALNTALNRNDDVFLTSGCLMKVDPLLLLDRNIPVSRIESMAYDKIVQKINLTHDDIKYMNDLPDYNAKENELEQALFFANEDLGKLQNELKSATSKSQKKKLNKAILKKKEEVIGLKLSIAENQESINDIKYYTLYNHLKEHRKKGRNPKVLQARQLEKDAIKAYKKAKMLRDKAYMLEETDITKALDYNNQAYQLENKGLSLMTKAYTVYMNIDENEIQQEILAENKANNPINEQIIEEKKADISEPTPFENTKQQNDSSQTQILIAENTNTTNQPENNISNSNSQENTTVQNNTNKSETQVAVTSAITNTTNKNTSQETENETITDKTAGTTVKETTTANAISEKTNNPEPVNTQTKETNIKKQNSNNETKTQIAENTTNSNFNNPKKYAIYPVSIYNDKNPIPVNPKLPEGIIFKVQIGAFKRAIPQDAFKGLSPLAAEKIPGSKFTRYLAGLFNTYEGARSALSEIKAIGYNDAFIVAYKNGKRVPIYLARNEAKQQLNNYDILAQTETKMVKSRNKNAVDINIVNKENNEDITSAETTNIVKAENIKQKPNLLYTVQIGVYKKPVSHEKLYNLSPIYEDVTPYGFIRYTTGIFSDRAKASEERDRIRKLGIKDAFVTAYYKGKKISLTDAAKLEAQNISKESEKEIILPQAKVKPANFNIDKNKLFFKVQIGAYKEAIPVEKVEWLSLARTKDLQQFKDERGYTVFAVGNYKSYKEAARMKQILINEGIKDAFVVAYEGKKKIPVAKAMELLNK